MAVNYYFKDRTTEKYLLYEIQDDGTEQIYGDYPDLKSLSAATTWIRKYKPSKYRVRKVRVVIEDIAMTEKDTKYISDMANKKGLNII